MYQALTVVHVGKVPESFVTKARNREAILRTLKVLLEQIGLAHHGVGDSVLIVLIRLGKAKQSRGIQICIAAGA